MLLWLLEWSGWCFGYLLVGALLVGVRIRLGLEPTIAKDFAASLRGEGEMPRWAWLLLFALWPLWVVSSLWQAANSLCMAVVRRVGGLEPPGPKAAPKPEAPRGPAPARACRLPVIEPPGRPAAGEFDLVSGRDLDAGRAVDHDGFIGPWGEKGAPRG